MIPMMLVLASYVGAMIMAMNMEQSSLAIGSGISKWRKFAVRGILHIAASVVVALAGTSMMFALGGESQSGFWQVWAFQTLFVMTFMFTAQFFLLLFGVAGMLFNIILLSLQLVSSGAMVPREMLSAFYRTLGDYLPATYAVEGTMNLLFGGPGIGSVSLTLVWIMLAAILAGLLAVAIRKEQPLHEPKTRLKTSES